MGRKHNIYLHKILEEFEAAEYRAVVVQKHYTKMSYLELYLDIKERYKTIQEAQELFIDVRPCDLQKLPFYKGKYPTASFSTLQSLYGSRDCIPSRAMCNNLRTLINQYKEHYKNENL